jgi:hypothetical protein
MNFELQTYFNQDNFVLQTYQQIMKDLNGLSDQESSEQYILEDPYTNLCEFILAIIGELSDSQDHKLAQFIYKVDLAENHFISLMQQGKISELSEHILNREALKVHLRWKLST